MLYKESPLHSFLWGKPFWPAFHPPLSSSFASLFTPVCEWPPSLVPTRETTAWIGICFSHATTPEIANTGQGQHPWRSAEILPAIYSQETCPLGSRARAPPLGVQ